MLRRYSHLRSRRRCWSLLRPVGQQHARRPRHQHRQARRQRPVRCPRRRALPGKWHHARLRRSDRRQRRLLELGGLEIIGVGAPAADQGRWWVLCLRRRAPPGEGTRARLRRTRSAGRLHRGQWPRGRRGQWPSIRRSLSELVHGREFFGVGAPAADEWGWWVRILARVVEVAAPGELVRIRDESFAAGGGLGPVSEFVVRLAAVVSVPRGLRQASEWVVPVVVGLLMSDFLMACRFALLACRSFDFFALRLMVRLRSRMAFHKDTPKTMRTAATESAMKKNFKAPRSPLFGPVAPVCPL